MTDSPVRFDAASFTATEFFATDHRKVRIAGLCEAPTTGYQVSLRHANPGVAGRKTNPEVLSLETDTTPPGDDEIVADIKTRITIDETFDILPEVARVSILRPFASIIILEIAAPQ